MTRAETATEGPMLRIGELSRRTAVPAGTLRAWQRRHGLLPSERTTGNQRLFPVSTVDTVRHVQDLHSRGVPMQEIARSLAPAARARSGQPGWMADQVAAHERASARYRELIEWRDRLLVQRDALLRHRTELQHDRERLLCGAPGPAPALVGSTAQ